MKRIYIIISVVFVFLAFSPAMSAFAADSDMFDAPIIEILPTQEQIEAERIEAEQKYQAKRAKDRERLRRWRERQKAKPMKAIK